MAKNQSKDQSKICRHISRIMGDDSSSSMIISEVQDWSRRSGPEWTVSRLKSMKQAAIDYIAFELAKPKVDRRYNCPAWVASHGDGFPKGHLGGLIRRTFTGPYSVRKAERLMSVLNVYTALISLEVTPSQRKKFLEAISGEPPKDFDKVSKEMWTIFSPHLGSLLPKMQAAFLKSYTEKFNFGGLNTSKPTLGPWKDRMKKYHPWTISLIESTMTTGPWTPILKNMGVPVIPDAPVSDHMGRINVLQEKGFKARVIAMPIAGIQVALQPLHTALSDVLRRLRADCTTNQMEGVQFAQESLMEGKTVHAVDLSSATDNFPLAYQLELLKALGYPHVDDFARICRSKWTSEYGDLTYTKGQPMGMYGSFSLFALAHHSLLISMENIQGVTNTYRILGDDIVINDDRIHELYLKALETMRIPVSTDKCLDSDLLTEFAGKMITPTGVIQTVKSPKQDSNLLGVQSFINYARVNGSTNHIKSVPKKYREFALALAGLPDSYGGAGINPDGLSLITRLTRFDQSTDKTLPKVLDLGLKLKEIAFAGNPWAKKVCSFINDQLIEVSQEIESELSRLIGKDLAHIYVGSENRNLLLQVLRSKDSDDTLAFKGAVSKKKASISVFDEWKLASKSTERTLLKKFDKAIVTIDDDKETLVSTAVKRKTRDSWSFDR